MERGRRGDGGGLGLERGWRVWGRAFITRGPAEALRVGEKLLEGAWVSSGLMEAPDSEPALVLDKRRDRGVCVCVLSSVCVCVCSVVSKNNSLIV